jgi:hypothetical protein
MGAGISLAILYVGGGSIALTVWGSIILVYFQLTILTAVAILFSSFSSSALSALLTFSVFIIGHFSAALRDFAAALGSAAAKYFFDFLYYVLPNFSFFNFSANASRGEFPPGAMLAGAFAYSIVYISILLAITFLIFRQRNFK